MCPKSSPTSRSRTRQPRSICKLPPKHGLSVRMNDSVFASLTPRERECLRGVRALMGSGEIARNLGIATGTVDAYIGTAKAKLGARARKPAAQLLAEHEGARDLAAELAPQKLAYET